MNHKKKASLSQLVQGGKQQFSIAIRNPIELPSNEIVLPTPEQLPSNPPQINYLTLLLPPGILIILTLVTSLIAGRALGLILPMLAMSVGYPIANLISLNVQKKKYEETIINRKANYKKILQQQGLLINSLIEKQRTAANYLSPIPEELNKIAQQKGVDERLWWRRIGDQDFLALRIGSGETELSFKVLPPTNLNQNDELSPEIDQFLERYHSIANMPKLVDLKRAGSVLIAGETSPRYRLTRRLITDVLVHHSPENVEVVVLSDLKDADKRWGWLKWAPHTQDNSLSQLQSKLYFTQDQISRKIAGLKNRSDEYRATNQFSSNQDVFRGFSTVVIMDDSGNLRKLPDIAELAAYGLKSGIYIIFVGHQNVPNTCRTRINVNPNARFEYKETWDAQSEIHNTGGIAEFMKTDTCESITREISSLEVAGGKASHSLPSTVRLSDIIDSEEGLQLDGIVANWREDLTSEKQVLFPAGQYVDQVGLRTLDIDFRPEHLHGFGEYHALLIGTTGSGKSIFLQSMVLASAQKYSPKYLNFLFMDFKAGAAELKKISGLPHVVGMVTDLDAALAERALQALESELSKRQIAFDNESNVTDIWDFNERFVEKAFPHLLVVIDEFAEGIKILPNLVERLKDLGRRGRAFGMYFFLANQEVNSAVDSLKPNVGWYIVLKVKRKDEMSLIDRTLPIAPGRGRGYARVKSDIFTFQGAYAGLPVMSESGMDVEEYTLSYFRSDGHIEPFYTHRPQNVKKQGKVIPTELDQLLENIQVAASQMGINSTSQIYTPPVPAQIGISSVNDSTMNYRNFDQDRWGDVQNLDSFLKVAIGLKDVPEICLQDNLWLDFNNSDGNLWIVGTPGSGKAMTLKTILSSIAMTHRPDEVNFYILDYSGDGGLRDFDLLPHTGAVIRLSEKERLLRLIAHIQKEIDKRATIHWKEEKEPDIFIVINNFIELYNAYPDETESFSSFVRMGKSVGIHLIITSNRGSELRRTISSNISNRIVLKMTNKEDYVDVLGSYNLPPLAYEVPGRGYFEEDGIHECQIANSEGDQRLSSLFNEMRTAWTGNLPKEIKLLPNEILFEEYIQDVKGSYSENPLEIPVGYAYEDLEVITSDWSRGINSWLVLGGRQRGKSNYLLSTIKTIQSLYPEEYEIVVFAPKKTSPFRQMNVDGVKVLFSEDDMLEVCEHVISKEYLNSSKKFLLIIDDLSGCFDTAKPAVSNKLNEIGALLDDLEDFYLLASGMRENLQQLSYSSALVKVLKQNGAGLAFSNDLSDLEWLGTSIALSQRKIQITPGRGYFVNGGVATLVQVPAMFK